MKADKIWGVRIGFYFFSQCFQLICFTQVKVVHSDNLYTGQNPASARELAEVILERLQRKA